MLRPLLCLAALLPLMACGESRDANEAAAAVPAPGNGYTARMATLNEGERNGVLFRAIRDARRDCQGVVSSRATSPVGGKPAWIATCDDRGEWLVALGDDGIATVTAATAQNAAN